MVTDQVTLEVGAMQGTVARRSVWFLLSVVVLCWLPVLIGRGAVEKAVALYPISQAGNAYFVPAHALLLYFVAPLVVLSACVLLLSPGLFLSIALNGAETTGEWILTAFGISIVTIGGVTTIFQALAGPLTSGAFLLLVVSCSAAAFVVLLVRGDRLSCAWPMHARSTLLTIAAGVLLCLILLAPKFYWEVLNGDGADAMESSKLLLRQTVPFWPASAGDKAAFPGITSMLFAYPASWFLRIFGEQEAAVRFPFLLALAAVVGGIVSLIETGRKTGAAMIAGLVWLSAAAYIAMLAFSASYDPYSADLSMPGAQDMLLVACYLGFILFFVRRRISWMALFAVLTFFSLPSGNTLILFWLMAVTLVWKPRPWREIASAGAVLFGLLLVSALLPALLARLHLPVPGNEYSLRGLLTRLNSVQWGDWRRLLFLVVPCGILPAAVLPFWKRQDQVGRSLTLVTLIYFGMFFVQAYISIHHFAPVMLLPIVVFWRSDWAGRERTRPYILAAAAGCGIIACLLSLPVNATPHQTPRIIGGAIEDRFGGYQTGDARTFRRIELFRYIVPFDWEETVPQKEYGGSPLVWNYYAQHASAETRAINYVLQPAAMPGPPGMHLLASEDDAALYVRDDRVLAEHRGLRPPSPPGSRIYAVPRWMLFHGRQPAGDVRVYNLLDTIKGLGVNLDSIVGRGR
jgi:hypothetical protein